MKKLLSFFLKMSVFFVLSVYFGDLNLLLFHPKNGLDFFILIIIPASLFSLCICAWLERMINE